MSTYVGVVVYGGGIRDGMNGRSKSRERRKEAEMKGRRADGEALSRRES